MRVPRAVNLETAQPVTKHVVLPDEAPPSDQDSILVVVIDTVAMDASTTAHVNVNPRLLVVADTVVLNDDVSRFGNVDATGFVAIDTVATYQQSFVATELDAMAGVVKDAVVVHRCVVLVRPWTWRTKESTW